VFLESHSREKESKISQSSVLVQLAKRFLFSKASGGFVSFITWVSIAGVALGIMALVVVTSVINGFEAELTRAVSGLHGDVFFYSRSGPVQRPEQIEERMKRLVPEAQAITRSFVMELMVAGSLGVAGGVLEGVDLETLSDVTMVPDRLTEGRMPREGNEWVLGASLAEKVGAKVGEPVQLVIPAVGPEGGEARALDQMGTQVISGEVVGIVRLGMHEYDSKYLFAPLESVQSLFQSENRVTTFKLKLSSRADPIVAADLLNDQFGYPMRARAWSQLNRNLMIAIQMEKAVISILLTAIVIVAAFNVVSTLMMMTHDKVREVSILKAMGLNRRKIFQLFSMIGMGIGTVGCFLGVIGGYVVNRGIERTDWVQLPPDIYHISFLPVVERWDEILIIVMVGLFISLLATLYPAYQVSRRSPLDGIRFE
jgi:lipoprotein-releasing system permease protein